MKNVQDCTAPDGYVEDNTDCDDNDASVHEENTFYQDSDQDGYGNVYVTQIVCGTRVPDGFVANHDDCNDNDSSINPNASEVCNHIDDNCSGVVDDVDESLITYFYEDKDADSYGNPDHHIKACFD